MTSYFSDYSVDSWVWIPKEKDNQDWELGQVTKIYGAGEWERMPESKTMGNREELGAAEVRGENAKRSLLFPFSRMLPTEPPLDDVKKGQEVGTADMAHLTDLSAPRMLENIRRRFYAQFIYTSVQDIVIALNPYADLGLYAQSYFQKYFIHALSATPIPGAAPAQPHIFQVANDAYFLMRTSKSDQSLLISGVSGSGKTEATKQVLHFLARASAQSEAQAAGRGASANAAVAASDGSASGLRRKLLLSSPLLEAFGNAKTVRNDNSSRFGKLMQVWFDHNACIISGQIIKYLLEESRVVRQAKGERNYHIFYQVAAVYNENGADKLMDMKAMHYLNQSGVFSVKGVSEPQAFKETKEAMEALGITASETNTVLAVIKAILTLGNMDFQGDPEAKVAPDPVSQAARSNVARLLSLSEQSLERACTEHTILSGRGSMITQPLNAEAATDSRDSLAKALYGKLFTWIVEKVNKSLEEERMTADGGATIEKHVINILDIFGFELFENNSLEQLFINYANEKLQQLFIERIFKIEQNLYKQENIDVGFIVFEDNQGCVDLLEKKPDGIIPMLNEELRLPRGSDTNLLQRYHQKHETNKYYEKPKVGGVPVFIVRHFADAVPYVITGFFNKNKHKIHDELVFCIKGSKNDLIKKLFDEDQSSMQGLLEAVAQADKIAEAEDEEAQRRATAEGRTVTKGPDTLKIRSERRKKTLDAAAVKQIADDLKKDTGGTAKQAPSTVGRRKTLTGVKPMTTLGEQFTDSLESLIDKLSGTSQHYVRCIKPNGSMLAVAYEPILVLQQLKTSGILDSVRIRTQGYSSRLLFKDFVKEYGYKKHYEPTSDTTRQRRQCEELMLEGMKDEDEKYRKPGPGWQVGRTKMFFKRAVFLLLEKAKAKWLAKALVVVQARQRGRRQRRLYKPLKEAYRRLNASIQVAKQIGIGSRQIEKSEIDALDAAIQPAKKEGVPDHFIAEAIKQKARLDKVLRAQNSLINALEGPYPTGSARIKALTDALSEATAAGVAPAVLTRPQAVLEQLQKILPQLSDLLINAYKSEQAQNTLSQLMSQLDALRVGSMAEVDSARKVVQNLDEVVNELKSGIQNKSFDLIKKALDGASRLGLERPEIQQGKAMLSETKLFSELTKAMERAKELASQAVTAGAQAEAEATETIRSIEVAMLAAQRGVDGETNYQYKYVAIQPLIAEAQALLPELRRKHEARKKVREAMTSSDLDLITSALREALAAGLSKLECSPLSELLEKEKIDKAIKTALSQAQDNNDIHKSTGDDMMFMLLPEEEKRERKRQEIAAFSQKEIAQRRTESELEFALTNATNAGVRDTNPEFAKAAAMLKFIKGRNAVAKALMLLDTQDLAAGGFVGDPDELDQRADQRLVVIEKLRQEAQAVNQQTFLPPIPMHLFQSKVDKANKDKAEAARIKAEKERKEREERERREREERERREKLDKEERERLERIEREERIKQQRREEEERLRLEHERQLREEEEKRQREREEYERRKKMEEEERRIRIEQEERERQIQEEQYRREQMRVEQETRQRQEIERVQKEKEEKERREREEKEAKEKAEKEAKDKIEREKAEKEAERQRRREERRKGRGGGDSRRKSTSRTGRGGRGGGDDDDDDVGGRRGRGGSSSRNGRHSTSRKDDAPRQSWTDFFTGRNRGSTSKSKHGGGRKNSKKNKKDQYQTAAGSRAGLSEDLAESLLGDEELDEIDRETDRLETESAFAEGGDYVRREEEMEVSGLRSAHDNAKCNCACGCQSCVIM